jgi:hypothetical protein
MGARRAIIPGITGQDGSCQPNPKFGRKAKTDFLKRVLKMVAADCAGEGVEFSLHAAAEAR